MTTSTLLAHPAFLAGDQPKSLFIDGRRIAAASGETFDSISPSIGELLARVAKAGPADVDPQSQRRTGPSKGPGVASSRSTASRSCCGRSRRQALRRAGDARHARHGRADLAHNPRPPSRRRAASLLRRFGDVDERRDDSQLGGWRRAIPFGGYKMSGFGRESGAEHMQEYSQTKAVMIKVD